MKKTFFLLILITGTAVAGVAQCTRSVFLTSERATRTDRTDANASVVLSEFTIRPDSMYATITVPDKQKTRSFKEPLHTEGCTMDKDYTSGRHLFWVDISPSSGGNTPLILHFQLEVRDGKWKLIATPEEHQEERLEFEIKTWRFLD